MSRREPARPTAPVSAPLKAATSTAFRVSDTMVIDIIAVGEVVIVIAAAVAAKFLYISLLLDDGWQSSKPYLVAGIAGGLVCWYVLRSQGHYVREALVDWRSSFARLNASIALSFLLLIALSYLLKVSADYSRGWLLIWLALTCAGLSLSRITASRVLSWLSISRYTERRIAIVVQQGFSFDRAHVFAAKLKRELGINIAGVFTGSGAGLSELARLNQNNLVDEVILLAPLDASSELDQTLKILNELPLEVWLWPDGLKVPVIGAAQLGTLSLLHLQPKPIRSWGYVIKLTLDYVLGGLLLLIMGPGMLLIAALIRLDSKGPALFRQTRHGYNRRVIEVFKFRTMDVMDNGTRIVQATRDDPRVTRVGRILRKTSLDELPQLFNVLRGEMSLVGPRPHAVAHTNLYGLQLERYAQRLCVKPGLTGLAQINGLRGPTDDPEKMRMRVQMDLTYIANWSIWLDLKILALTPFLGLVNRNAI
jgi:Undecaprenyl-phosphate glucose phosphotransferase